MILNGMRILLHRMVRAIGERNAIGVNTDCIYTALSKDDVVKRLSEFRFKQGVKYDDIGSLRFESGKLPCNFGMYTNTEEHSTPTPLAFSTQQQVYMRDEYDDDEAEEILDEGSPLLVVGKYPRTGKSRLALHWGEERRLLAVCPTNALQCM